MLAEAESKLMSIKNFMNWAVNWELSYSDEVAAAGGEPQTYSMTVDGDSMHFLRLVKKGGKSRKLRESVYE